MDLIADGLLLLGALTASLYCLVLSRRLRQLTQTENGLGKVITTLSQQVEDMQVALSSAKQAVEAAGGDLAKQTSQAERVKRGLEELVEQTVGQLADLQADIQDLSMERERIDRLAKSLAPEVADGVGAEPDNATGSEDLRTSDAPKRDVSRGSSKGAGSNSQRDLVEGRRVEAKSDVAPAQVAAQNQLRQPDEDLQEAEQSSSSGSPYAAAKSARPQRGIANTVGSLLAFGGEDDDDEAFSRRLIDALSGADPTPRKTA